MSLPRAHQEFLNDLKAKSENADGILGVAISGSIANSTADNESDVDVIIVLDDRTDNSVASRLQFVSKFGPLLSAFDYNIA